jgi:hypothetical protein
MIRLIIYTSLAPLNEPPTDIDKFPFGLYWLFLISSSYPAPVAFESFNAYFMNHAPRSNYYIYERERERENNEGKYGKKFQ